MDRISELPESIIHHILSFFSGLDAKLVRMSVLSKHWFDLTASFPILNFNIYCIKSLYDVRESFFKHVEYTTSRFCHHNLAAHKFQLVTTLQEPAEVDIINKCLRSVCKIGVRKLNIYIVGLPYSQPMYRLPNILLHVSVLESLSISGCELPSSLMVDVVQFKSLIQLRLFDVPIDDEVIKYLTASCPLLQVLEVIRCRGLRRICVYGHQNLRKVDICIDTQVEVIDIDAPNLHYISVRNWHVRGPPLMNLASCIKLTTVHYSGYPLPDDFLSNFPFIENLHLVTKGYNLLYDLGEAATRNLNWSSHSLRTLVLESESDLEDIEFHAPNLVLFMYDCKSYRITMTDKSWPLLRDSTHLKECMHFQSGRNISHALWFQKLRRFLDKKNGFKVLNLYIHAFGSKKPTDLEKLKAIELLPYELEHVEALSYN